LRYWESDEFQKEIKRKSDVIYTFLSKQAAEYPEWISEVKGTGFIQGMSFRKPELASKVCKLAFQNGLIMETSGPFDEVAKLMPPLTIEDEVLKQGLAVIEQALQKVIESEARSKAKTIADKVEVNV
ncbi:MAG TPA: aminotransferase class III-fold pyridoxal phosphate-dependent enzyme, partial [Candidatus Udaeobacter sp.]|nr:aminotransferase class III-fold pyridoxal phosphate-dependent enzyme [Candidatus Udaeobacter sp.]